MQPPSDSDKPSRQTDDSAETESTTPGFDPVEDDRETVTDGIPGEEIFSDAEHTFENPPRPSEPSIPPLLRSTGPDHKPGAPPKRREGFKTAPAATPQAQLGRSAPEPRSAANVTQPATALPAPQDDTRPLEPLDEATPAPLPPPQLRSGAQKANFSNPVMAPDPERIYPASLGAAPEGPPLRVTEPVMHTPAPDQPAPPARRRSTAPLAATVFLLCFTATGVGVWWMLEREAEDRGERSEETPATEEAPATPEVLSPPAGTVGPAQMPAPAVPAPLTPPTTTPPPAAPTASSGPQHARELLRLGDEEARSIVPYLAVSVAPDLARALDVPRSRYDAAIGHYVEAQRHDPSLSQCVLARRAIAAERLASALATTASAPSIRAIDPSRFPSELRDTSQNYQNIARRLYERAAAEITVHQECAEIARRGLSRSGSPHP